MDTVRETKGYSNIKDHTRQQSEVYKSTGKKVKKAVNIYDGLWDFDNTDNLSQKELIEKNVKSYIDACEKLGYLPKFREYVMDNEQVLNDVLRYSKELGFSADTASVNDISFEYKGYRIPYGYYKCLVDFSVFKPDGTASPHEVLSLKNYDFDKAVKLFEDSETLRRNEILQQFANDGEREAMRRSNMTTEELAEEVNKRRKAVVDKVAPKYSLPLDLQDQIDNFSRQIDNIDTIPSGEALVVCGTPPVFLDIGMNNLPMTLNLEHAKDAITLNPRHRDRYIGKSTLKSLPQALQNPIAIIASQTQQSTSLVAIVDLKGQNGKNVIAPVVLNGISKSGGTRMDVNYISSVHERRNAVSNLLMNAINNEANGDVSVFYVDNKKATQLIRGEGLQLPNSFMSMNGFVHSISENGSPVKGYFKKISQTETKQFKKWFGNSKAVNEDGTPKVYYHGSNANFTVFKESKDGALGKGIYFSGSKEYAQGVAPNGTVYECYLSVQNPYIAKYPGGIDQAKLIAQGYDGVYNPSNDFMVVFDSSQAKSATDNIGTFSGSNDIRYSLPLDGNSQEFVSETIGSIRTKVDENYKAPLKDKVFSGWTASQIAFTNAQAGIESIGKKLGIKDIETLVQTVRAANSQADEMIAGNQYRIGADDKVYQGEGLICVLTVSYTLLDRLV